MASKSAAVSPARPRRSSSIRSARALDAANVWIGKGAFSPSVSLLAVSA